MKMDPNQREEKGGENSIKKNMKRDGKEEWE